MIKKLIKKLTTRQELADIIGLHRKTMWKDITEAHLDVPQRKRLGNDAVKKILDFYGIEEGEDKDKT